MPIELSDGLYQHNMVQSKSCPKRSHKDISNDNTKFDVLVLDYIFHLQPLHQILH